MEIIRDNYSEALRNEIRNNNSNSELLKSNLIKLGKQIGEKITKKYYLDKKDFVTPMGFSVTDIYPNYDKIAVVSTKDDYEFFGKGISDVFPNVVQGQMDFGGNRGLKALSSPLRSVTLPDAHKINTLIIAKSVLATGCTAITLTEKSIQKYWPERVIVSAIFYTKQGVIELSEKFKSIEIIVIGDPDNLDRDGYLIPGVGDLDKRVSAN